MKKKRILLILLSLCIVLTSCSVSNNNASYAAIVIVNGEKYIKGNSDNLLQTGDFIGVVTKKVMPQSMPKNDFESNMLEEGTKLYRTVDNKDLIIAINEHDKYIFRKAK